MIYSKHKRIFFAMMTVFLLTSSCEDDKKENKFGDISIKFNYTSNTDDNTKSNDEIPDNDKKVIKNSLLGIEKEGIMDYPRDFTVDSPEIDNEDLNKNTEKINDVQAARITIGDFESPSIVLNLSQTNSYSRPGLSVGSTLIDVELLDSYNPDNPGNPDFYTVLYKETKTVSIIENETVSVTFNDWTPLNQTISWFGGLEDAEYEIGDLISFSWTNTHAQQPVSIFLIQNTLGNVIKILESDYTGNSYVWDTSSESEINNIGFQIQSTIVDNTSASSCCINLIAGNSAPVTSSIQESTDEDNGKTITLVGSDSDGDDLTYSIVSTPSNGSLSAISGNTVTYTSNQDWNGTDTFTYKANDGSLDSNTSTVTITVNAVNDAPTTIDVSAETDENLSISRIVGITLEGSDVDGDNLTYSIVSTPSNGSLSAISGNTVTYTSNQDWNGTDTFTYKANDGSLDSNTSTVTITVNAVNDAPVAEDTSISTDEDTAVNIDLSNFYSDIDVGDNSSFSLKSDASNGLLARSESIVTYTPNQDWNGTDSFTWGVSDGEADSNIATVTITVTAVNDAPTTDGGKTYSTPKDTALDIVLGGNDIEGDALSYIITEDNVTSSGNATLSLDGNVVTITPTSDPSTTIKVNFRYKVNDGNLDSDEANVITYITANEFTNPVQGQFWKKGNSELIAWTEDFSEAVGLYLIKGDDYQNAITITNVVQDRNHSYNVPLGLDTESNYRILIAQSVTPSFPNGLYHFSDYFTINENSPPISNDQTINGTVNTDLSFTLTASDEENNNLTYIIVEQPQFGTISGIDSQVLNDNTGIYTPNVNNTGVDSFTFKVNDGELDSNISTVLLGISNSAPSTADVTFATDEDTPYNYTLPAIDSDGDSLTYIVVNGPNTNDNNGSVSISGHIATFTPNQDWNGSDYFTVKANDRLLDGNNAKINVQVDPVDDPPYVSNPEFGAFEDTDKTFGSNVVHNLGGDIDGPGTLSLNILTGPFHGSFVASPYVYRADEDWFGTDSLTYTISNNTGGGSDQQTSEVGVWKINVQPVNDPPIARNFIVNTPKNVPISIDLIEDTVGGVVLVTDVDNNREDLSVTNDRTGPTTYTEGIVEFQGNVFTFTPTEDYTTTTTTIDHYKAFDGELYSDVECQNQNECGRISVQIQNNKPTVNDVSVSTEQNLIKSITFDGEDINGDDLTYSIVSSPSNGTLGNISGDTVLYTPNTNWTGTDTFTYEANDGTVNSATNATVTITVNEGDITTYSPSSYPTATGMNYTGYVINVPKNGKLIDLDIELAMTGGRSNHLRYMNAILVSPNKTRVLLFGGDQTSVECNNTGGCIDVDANGFFNTTLNDEASTPIYNGSPPYIGSFTPNQSLSTFDNEEVNGDWIFYVLNASSNSIDFSTIKLYMQIDQTQGGTTYTETNNSIYSPSDQSTMTINGNSTGIISIPVSLSSGQSIEDLDFELSLRGGRSNHLRYMSITVDIGNANNAELVFRGDQVSGSSNAYERDRNYMHKARFDDESSLNYSSSLMFNQRVRGINSGNLSAFDGQTLTEFRIYIFNNDSNSIEIDRANTKLFIKSKANTAPTSNDVSSSTNENTAVTITLEGSDADGDDLTYSIVSNPSNGTLGSISGNTVIYTPGNSWAGTDTFTYKANDGLLDSNISTVSITVNSGSSWVGTIGSSGSNTSDIGRSVVETSLGKYVLTGMYDSDAYYAEISDTDNDGTPSLDWSFSIAETWVSKSIAITDDGGYITTGQAQSKVFLNKIDSGGTIEWNGVHFDSVIGSSGHTGNDVIQTSDGGYVVAGDNGKPFLLKFNSAGGIEWSKLYNSSDPNGFLYDVEETNDGGYIAVGELRTGASGATGDAYAIKTNASGDLIWGMIYGGSDRDTFKSVKQTDDGGYIFFGSYDINNNTSEFWLVKTDSVGEKEWEKLYGGSQKEWGMSMDKTADGGYILVGYSESFGDNHIYLVKTDSSGNVEWTKTKGANIHTGVDATVTHCVIQISSGGYVIVGQTSDGADDQDIFIFKLDDQGNRIW